MLVLLTRGGIMATTKPDNGAPLEDDYDYFPLRRLMMPDIENFAVVGFPLKDFAKEQGYIFQVSSPEAERDSIVYDIDSQSSFIIGSNRLGAPGLQFAIYWRADMADDQAFDVSAERLWQVLAPFGTVTVTAAPLDTRPRKESTNLWRKRR